MKRLLIFALGLLAALLIGGIKTTFFEQKDFSFKDPFSTPSASNDNFNVPKEEETIENASSTATGSTTPLQ